MHSIQCSVPFYTFVNAIKTDLLNEKNRIICYLTENKRGCEITLSTEKEDFSFKMNERSSFMLKLTCDENFNYKL